MLRNADCSKILIITSHNENIVLFLSQSVTFKDTQGKVTKAAEKAQKKK